MIGNTFQKNISQKPSKKLLFMFPSTIRGGAEEYILKLGTAIVDNQWEVHSAFPKTQQTESLIKDFQKAKINYHLLNLQRLDEGNFKFFKENIPNCLKTLRLILKINPDVVFINVDWPTRCLGIILACALLKMPTIVRFALVADRIYLTNVRRQIYLWAKARNQQWLTVSENNRQLICQSFNLSEEEILKVYNGTKLNTKLLNLVPREINEIRYEVREEFQLPNNSKILITVGRLHDQKGYLQLINIAREIIQEFPDVRFLWVGEGNLRKTLEEKIEMLKLQKYVVLSGYRSDVSRLLKASDIFIFPTHCEGFSSALIEAMSHQLPIIASDASSIPEIIDNKINGLLVLKRDEEQLKKAIIWALKNPKDMEEMAKNAAIRVQDFSEVKMIDKTFKIIENLSNIRY